MKRKEHTCMTFLGSHGIVLLLLSVSNTFQPCLFWPPPSPITLAYNVPSANTDPLQSRVAGESYPSHTTRVHHWVRICVHKQQSSTRHAHPFWPQGGKVPKTTQSSAFVRATRLGCVYQPSVVVELTKVVELTASQSLL